MSTSGTTRRIKRNEWAIRREELGVVLGRARREREQASREASEARARSAAKRTEDLGRIRDEVNALLDGVGPWLDEIGPWLDALSAEIAEATTAGAGERAAGIEARSRSLHESLEAHRRARLESFVEMRRRLCEEATARREAVRALLEDARLARIEAVSRVTAARRDRLAAGPASKNEGVAPQTSKKRTAKAKRAKKIAGTRPSDPTGGSGSPPVSPTLGRTNGTTETHDQPRFRQVRQD